MDDLKTLVKATTYLSPFLSVNARDNIYCDKKQPVHCNCTVWQQTLTTLLWITTLGSTITMASKPHWRYFHQSRYQACTIQCKYIRPVIANSLSQTLTNDNKKKNL